MKAKVITFAHHKGGSGKTSSCISVAGYLAKAGKKVLVVDLDSQGNATAGFGIDKDGLNGSMLDVMKKKTGIGNVILKTDIENLHLAPANVSLTLSDTKAYRSKKDLLILDNVLKGVKGNYDYILIDTPPAFGRFVINAALASDEVVLVLDPGIFALEGVKPLRETFEEYGKKAGKSIKVNTVILTKCRNSWLPFFTNPTRDIGAELKKLNKNVCFVPYSDKIYESQLMGTPISHYKPNSDVGRSYEKIAEMLSGDRM